MPRAPRKCARPECETRGHSTYCPEHTPPPWSGSTHPGSTRASRALREKVLNRDPVCACPGCPRCTPIGCWRPSTEDDHVAPLAQGGGDHLANHAGKCEPCHKLKTQREAVAGRMG